MNGQPYSFPIPLGHFATLSPNGRRIAICRNDAVVIADAESGKISATISESAGRASFSGFSPSGDRLFVVYDNRTVRLWDSVSGEAVTPLLSAGAEKIESVKFSTDGRYLVAADNHPGGSDLLFVWDLEDLSSARRFTMLDFEGRQATFLSVADDFACAPTDVFVNVASLESGRQLYPPLAHADSVASVRISPDKKLLLSCDKSHSARIWDARSGKPVSDWFKHDAAVCVAEFSPDGRRAVTCSVDGEIAIWDVDRGQRVLPILRHPDRIWAARFAPNGRTLITSSIRGGTRVWDLAGALAAPSLVRYLESWVPKCRFTASAESDLLLTAVPQGRSIRTFDIATGAIATPPIWCGDTVVSSAVHPDGVSLVTSCFDGRIARSSLTDGSRIFRQLDFRLALDRYRYEQDGLHINPQGQPFLSSECGFAITRDGKWIVAHNNFTQPIPWYSELGVLDAETGQPLSTKHSFDAPINDSLITPDGKHWVGCSGRHFHPYLGCRIEIRTVPELELVRTINFRDTVRSLDVTRDGKTSCGGGRKAGSARALPRSSI